MKYVLQLSLICLLALCFFSCQSDDKEKPPSHIVLVSIAPYKYLVEEIAGDTVTVEQMVPPGGSPHSFEPTAKKILTAAKADLWIKIGEPFEERAEKAMLSSNPRMRMVDIRNGVKLLSAEEDGHHHGHCHGHDCKDPHIWLSPRLMKQQAETIAEHLGEIYPEHKDAYHAALRQLQKSLDDLDIELSKQLHPMRGKTILVSHPAFAYLCKDYGFYQMAIEFEGKEPTPQHLTRILKTAREMESPIVYVQEQHLGKGAKLVADELNAAVVSVDPLAEDYHANMIEMAKKFRLSAQSNQ